MYLKINELNLISSKELEFAKSLSNIVGNHKYCNYIYSNRTYAYGVLNGLVTDSSDLQVFFYLLS